MRFGYFLVFFYLFYFESKQIMAQISQASESLERQVRIGAYISGVTHLFEGSQGEDDLLADFFPLRSFGVPVGINFWINHDLAFSIEFVPEVNVEDGLEMEKLLFHPGFIWILSNRTSFAARLAFDTSGSVGFTPVLGYNIIQLEQSSVSLGIPFPIRFGNDMPLMIAIGLQLGWGF
ncbi:MAG: hypothetical protein LAT68_08115 [Cyclobacteriaceae bacterium]|nr:hypothetical protein [Cyclobacteriaceae bacterium]MCH8516279.1 hypothetical protein [Cyclobacteriaceae bacterium]